MWGNFRIFWDLCRNPALESFKYNSRPPQPACDFTANEAGIQLLSAWPLVFQLFFQQTTIFCHTRIPRNARPCRFHWCDESFRPWKLLASMRLVGGGFFAPHFILNLVYQVGIVSLCLWRRSSFLSKRKHLIEKSEAEQRIR